MSALAQPFFFGPAARPLFGWLHRPDPERSADVGLLICNPLGYDAISGHRTLRHLAQSAAGQGIAALRFDYDGTGDSAGQDTEPARVAAWLDSIGYAAAALREQAGVRHIAVFGVGLGGTLALLAAQPLAAVAAILIDPVVTGRRYLRELRALAATSAVATATESDVQTAAGFITTVETRQSIAAMHLAGDSLQGAPPRVLLLERTGLKPDDALAEHLRQLGSEVTRQSFSGYTDMLRDAHETVVPAGMIQDALRWLRQSVTGAAAAPAAGLADHCEMSWSAADQSGRLREQAVRFGTRHLFGIVTESCAGGSGAAAAPVLLLLNSGSVHHVGPNRLYVRIARQLALRGFKVLRVDLPGLGDTPAPAGGQENLPYPEWALAAAGQIVEYARERLGAGEIHSAGICSGAYHSLKAAVAGLPLRSIVVINPLTFFWKAGMSLSVPAYMDTASVLRYRRGVLSASSLRRLLTGQVNLIELLATLSRYGLRRARHATRELGRGLGMRLRDDLVAELREIRRHGTQIHFVFAGADPGHAMLQEQGGAEVRRLQRAGTLTIDLIDQADHTFTPPAAQQALLELLARILAPPLPPAAS